MAGGAAHQGRAVQKAARAAAAAAVHSGAVVAASEAAAAAAVGRSHVAAKVGEHAEQIVDVDRAVAVRVGVCVVAAKVGEHAEQVVDVDSTVAVDVRAADLRAEGNARVRPTRLIFGSELAGGKRDPCRASERAGGRRTSWALAADRRPVTHAARAALERDMVAQRCCCGVSERRGRQGERNLEQ